MPLGTIGLTTYRWGNSRKAWVLLGLYPLVTALLLWCQIYAIYYVSNFDAHLDHAVLKALTNDFYLHWSWVFFTALAGWFWYAWTHHASIIRGLCLSRPLSATDNPSLYALVETACIAQGLATPDIQIIDTPARNSFVTALGRDDSYRLFLTQGLIDALQTDELEAVIAHEIAHILNGDTRLLSVSIAFTDLYPFVVRSRQRPRHFESPAAHADDSANLLAFLLIHPLLFLLLLPLAVGFIVMSLIRVFLFMRREHDADAVAIEITKNPDALMRALLRISRRARITYVTRDIRFLCIENPAGGFFATHPRISSRLKVISELTNTPVPTIEESSAAETSKRFQKNILLKRVFKARDPLAPKPFNAPWK